MLKGRITEAHRTNFTVTADGKEYIATVRGVFHAEGDFPKVGDYVYFDLLDSEKAVIEKVEERKSIIKRKSADGEDEQIIATNVDVIFIVMGLDGDFNINRLERYLLLAEQSEVRPVVVLNKSDILEDTSSQLAQVKAVTREGEVLLTSATTGAGMKELSTFIEPEHTAVLLGSSGAGKSTITNWLLSEETQEVKDVRQDDSRGRHTTTSRQLFVLPQGGFLIDTPGMRELGIVESDADDEMEVFNRIENFANQCKFSNCDHEKSAGCAVLEALEIGELTERELNNYHKLLRERDLAERKDLSSAAKSQAQAKRREQKKLSIDLRKRLSRKK